MFWCFSHISAKTFPRFFIHFLTNLPHPLLWFRYYLPARKCLVIKFKNTFHIPAIPPTQHLDFLRLKVCRSLFSHGEGYPFPGIRDTNTPAFRVTILPARIS